MKVVFSSFDRIDENFISQYQSEIIFWISRHRLNQDQLQAFVDLHGEEATVIHLNNVDFPNLRRFVGIVEYCSRFGTVYAVPRREPHDYIKEVESGHTRPITFRTFRGYRPERSNTFKLLGVYEVGRDRNELIYNFRSEPALSS